MEVLKKYHNNSIREHRKLIKKYLEKFSQSELATALDFSISDATKIAQKHDLDKCPGGNLYEAYVKISYLYHCKYNDIPAEIDYTMDLDDATRDHIINNSHHPEYWDANYEPVIVTDFKNRDSTTINSVSGKDMDDEAIIEMCADWCAVGAQRGNSAYAWASKVRENKRYTFTKEQWNFIYEILDIMN